MRGAVAPLRVVGREPLARFRGCTHESASYERVFRPSGLHRGEWMVHTALDRVVRHRDRLRSERHGRLRDDGACVIRRETEHRHVRSSRRAKRRLWRCGLLSRPPFGPERLHRRGHPRMPSRHGMRERSMRTRVLERRAQRRNDRLLLLDDTRRRNDPLHGRRYKGGSSRLLLCRVRREHVESPRERSGRAYGEAARPLAEHGHPSHDRG